MRGLLLPALFFLLLLPLPRSSAAAQAISGVVVDDGSGTGVAGAVVLALDSAGATAGGIETDAAGRFLIILPDAGRYALAAERLGYAGLASGALAVGGDDVVEVELRLARAPVALAPVRASAERRMRHMERGGFYRRQAMGIGRFITADDIEERNPMMITDVLRMEPSVKVVHTPPDLAGHAVFRRSIGMSVNNVCAPLLVLDGFRLSSRPPKIDELVHPNDVEAIEVFPGSHGAPGRFLNPCGVIMIWTKRGR